MSRARRRVVLADRAADEPRAGLAATVAIAALCAGVASAYGIARARNPERANAPEAQRTVDAKRTTESTAPALPVAALPATEKSAELAANDAPRRVDSTATDAGALDAGALATALPASPSQASEPLACSPPESLSHASDPLACSPPSSPPDASDPPASSPLAAASTVPTARIRTRTGRAPRAPAQSTLLAQAETAPAPTSTPLIEEQGPAPEIETAPESAAASAMQTVHPYGAASDVQSADVQTAEDQTADVQTAEVQTEDVQSSHESPAATESVGPDASAPAATAEVARAAGTLKRGRVAYLHCDGVPLQSGPFPCPRDRAFEMRVWRVLDRLPRCAGTEGLRGRGEVRIEFEHGRTDLAFLSDEFDPGPVRRCADASLRALRTTVRARRMIVSFRFELH